MPFPLTPSPRRDPAAQPAPTDTNRQISGPSALHSPEPAPLADAPSRSGDSSSKSTFNGTACGCRSTRPTGVR